MKKEESKHNLNEIDWKANNNDRYLEFQRIQQKGDNLPFKYSTSMLVKIKFQKLNLRNQSVIQQTETSKTRNSLNTTHFIMQAIRLEAQKLNLKSTLSCKPFA